MKNTTVKMLGMPLIVAVAESIEEFDQLAGRTGAGLDSANSNEIYRGVLTEARDEFCTLLEQQTGIERKTKESGRKRKNDTTGEEEPVYVYAESEAEYVRRVVALLTEQHNAKMREQNPEHKDIGEIPWQEEFKQIVARLSVGGDKEVKFDPKKTERGGPRKMEPRFLKAADDLIGKGLVEQWVAKYGGDGSREAIATKVRELQLAEEAKQDLSAKFI